MMLNRSKAFPNTKQELLIFSVKTLFINRKLTLTKPKSIKMKEFSLKQLK